MTQTVIADRKSRPRRLARWSTNAVLRAGRRLLNWNPEGAILLELPDGQRVRFGDDVAECEAVVRLHNYSVIPAALRRGSIGFAQAFMAGDLECDDLVQLFRFFLRNRARFEKSGGKLFKVRAVDRIAHLLRPNSRRGSRRNITDHYDLGNAFYRLWLDTDMVYSSGFYISGAQSLEDAQQAKIDLVLDHLDLAGGEHVLEIGCGWGAFARRAARCRDVRVRGITLSRAQLDHARASVPSDAWSERCTFHLQDYRDTRGQYDRVASIEMIEAVGEKHWPQYFNTIHDRLKPGGLAAIQAITMDEARYDAYRAKPDFIQRYIFPGGMLPTASIIDAEARACGLIPGRMHRFGACYARTLKEWRGRFDAAWHDVSALGFDDRFRRKWIYYLSYCEAAFAEGIIDVAVYQFQRPATW